MATLQHAILFEVEVDLTNEDIGVDWENTIVFQPFQIAFQIAWSVVFYSFCIIFNCY